MFFKHLKGATAAAIGLIVASIPAFAQDVTLRSLDGAVELRGELLGFDGQTYTLRTRTGDYAVSASAAVCEGDACPGPGSGKLELNISGPDVLLERVMKPVLNAYASELDARAEETRIGSSTINKTISDTQGNVLLSANLNEMGLRESFDAMLGGAVKFVMMARPVQPPDAAALAAAGFGDMTSPRNEHVVALDGLVIVVSPSNPLDVITEETVARIFAGTVTNWAQVGGRDAPINVYLTDDDSGATEVLEALIMEPAGLTIRDGGVPGLTAAQVANAVVADPNGIGFTGLRTTGDAKPLVIEGVCGLQSAPTAFNIKTEEYPLTRLIYVYTPDETGLAADERKFLDFMASGPAQEAISKAGYAGQIFLERAVDAQGLRFASAILSNNSASAGRDLVDMVSNLISARRLSATFRYQIGSTALDPRADTDIARLADYLTSTVTSPKEVLLVGFTDSVGDDQLNRELSRTRAAELLETLLARHPELSETHRFSALGYGEIAPLGCNETEKGRRINRRVEVWLKDQAIPN